MRFQRLIPRWRAPEAVREPPPLGGRGTHFRLHLFGAVRPAAVIAAVAAGLTVAHAAGPSSAPSQQAPAPSQEAPAPAAEAPPAPIAAAPDDASAKRMPVATNAPPCMVPYDKPVFRNGIRLLWHGAWRNGGPPCLAAPPRPAAAATIVAPANSQDILILADSTDASATRMGAELAAAMHGGGFPTRAVAGETSAASLGKAIAADSASLAIVSMDGLIESLRKTADKGAIDWRDRAPYLALLSREPIAVIARREISDIRRLAGRKVNVQAAGGAAAASAAIVFSRLDVAPEMTNEPLPKGLAAMARGEIDAVFTVGGANSRTLAEFGKDGRFHIVAIPYAPALQALYSPMRLTARDQPNLVGDDEKVDTIGVTTALVAIDAPPDSSRAGRLAPLADALFDKFDQLLGASSNPKWKGVNLAASIAGWPRLGAAQAWLEQNKGAPNPALDAFRDIAQSAAAASEGPSGADADRLYDSLMQLTAPPP